MTTLQEIVAYKKQELAQLKQSKSVGMLERELKNRPPVRNFQRAIRREGHFSLIAEMKRSSPSAGPIRPDADPVEIAKIYANAGAQAISVLTDSKFFSGSLKDLRSIREKCSLPILRKDFLLEEYSLVEAAAAGADAILLIAAILDRKVLKRLLQFARDLAMTPLLEVHTEQEIQEALDVGASVIGINNRDLATMKVDLKTTQRLLTNCPKDRTVVSESGLHSREDVEMVRCLGVHAILIGEEFMKSSDIAARVKELMPCG